MHINDSDLREEMDLIFVDKWNRSIHLSDERIKHIGIHMQLHNKVHVIENTLRAPDIFAKDYEQEGIHYCNTYLKQENLYFVVVVKYDNGSGFIVTIFERNKPKGIS